MYVRDKGLLNSLYRFPQIPADIVCCMPMISGEPVKLSVPLEPVGRRDAYWLPCLATWLCMLYQDKLYVCAH